MLAGSAGCSLGNQRHPSDTRGTRASHRECRTRRGHGSPPHMEDPQEARTHRDIPRGPLCTSRPRCPRRPRKWRSRARARLDRGYRGGRTSALRVLDLDRLGALANHVLARVAAGFRHTGGPEEKHPQRPRQYHSRKRTHGVPPRRLKPSFDPTTRSGPMAREKAPRTRPDSPYRTPRRCARRLSSAPRCRCPQTPECPCPRKLYGYGVPTGRWP